MKEVMNQNLWIFEVGSQETMNVPIWIITGFQQKDRQDRQNFKNDTFCRLPVVSAQCVIGMGKNRDVGILLSYDDDDYAQGHSQIKEAFRVLTKDNILQTNISDDDFRSSNNRADDVGYNSHVSSISYQKNFTNSQPIEVELEFNGVVPYDKIGMLWF